ncbi:MAG: SDR family NAD(P)-dependent oxidoreductase [Alphaproteobacteria bacterium]
MDRDENKPVDRRRFMVAGAAGLAALGAGAALAETGKPGTYSWEQEGNAGRFAGKSVLITGATSGIGAATARAFAAEGANVMFCGRREALGAEVEKGIRDAGNEATYMRADVRENDQVKAFADACVDRYGGIDIGFNNAGIAGPAGSYADAALDGTDGYHDVMKTNVDGVFYAMRHEIPVMLEQGHGIIINTASMLGSKGSAGVGPYSATKHAVVGLTRSAALLYTRQNLRIVSISPGPVDTPLMRAGGNDLSRVAAANPSGRLATPEEIAEMVLVLAAPHSGFVNGEDFKVDGGASA